MTRYQLDICPYCNGCGWSNPAQAIDKCDFCAGSGAITRIEDQKPIPNAKPPHAPDGEKCWCGQYHPTDKDIGIDD